MIGRILLFGGIIALLLAAMGSQFFKGGAQASPALAGMAPTASGIHMALIENYGEASPMQEVGKVDLVWDAGDFWHVVNRAAPGVHHDLYLFFDRDTIETSHHGLAWLQANHPDWIEYGCNRTPLQGNGWVELDVTNLAVRDYVLSYVEAGMNGGYNGVDFDVTDTFNYQHVCGHYDANGVWHRQYTGAVVDPAYRRDIKTSFRLLANEIHQVAAERGIPFSIGINPAFDSWKPSKQVEDLFPYVDIVLDEDGFTRGGWASLPRLTTTRTDDTANEWWEKITWYRDLDRMGKAIIIGANQPYTVDPTHAPRPADVNWVLANYLLVRGDHTYQAPLTTEYTYRGVYYPVAAYHAPIGMPTGAMERVGAAWERSYTHGLAVVNPSANTAATLRLPVGRYHDIWGNAIGGTVTVAPASALVLLGRTTAAVPSSNPPIQEAASTRVHRNLLRDGGFEHGQGPWRESSRAGYQLINAFRPGSGKQSLDLCGYTPCAEHAAQTVTIPLHAHRLVLRYALATTSLLGAVPSTRGTFTGRIETAAGRIITRFARVTGRVSISGFRRHAVNLTTVLSPYRGQTVKIIFAAHSRSAHPGAYFVDNVSLKTAAASRVGRA